MTNIYESEKLNSIRNEMTHLWGSIFIVGGGAVAFLINGTHSYDYYIGTLGLLLALLFAYAYEYGGKKMNIQDIAGWTAAIGFTVISLFAIYKYTKQNRDLKW